MKLTVLGKYGPYPKAGHTACSGYLVENNGDYLLMDIGSGVLGRLCDTIDMTRLKYVYLSHLHYDHTADLLPLRYLLEDLKHNVTVFAHQEDTDWYRLLLTHPNIDVVPYDEDSVITAGSMELRFFKMKHTVPTYAIRVSGDGVLVYSGDTVMNDNIYTSLVGADCFLADCGKPIGFTGPHMTVTQAKEITRQTGVPILVTHLSPSYNPTADIADTAGLRVVEELQTYEIKKR